MTTSSFDGTASMQLFSQTCERIAATTKKLEKTAIVANYLKSRTLNEAATSAIFLSGRPFAVWEEITLQVGGSLLWRTVAELAGKDEKDLTAAYRKLGDLGAVAGEVLPERKSKLHILDVEKSFGEIAAARGPSAKGKLTRSEERRVG